MAKIAVVQTL